MGGASRARVSRRDKITPAGFQGSKLLEERTQDTLAVLDDDAEHDRERQVFVVQQRLYEPDVATAIGCPLDQGAYNPRFRSRRLDLFGHDDGSSAPTDAVARHAASNSMG
jgi:hypothetical protein